MNQRRDRQLDNSVAAFDAVATRYDAESTYVELSIWFRKLVWERMERIFRPGMHLLELGCGTGEDALWNAARGIRVTATDASAAMLEETRRKATAAGLEDRVDLQLFDFSKPEELPAFLGPFDGVYSNYGALNCIEDFKALGQSLGQALRAGGIAGFCLIGRYCPWEIIWHGMHLHPRIALRRIPGKAIAHLDGRYFPVSYPTPGTLARQFGDAWTRTDVHGVGVWLPPSDLYHGIGKHPRLARVLLRLEKKSAGYWPFKYLGDHYWIELKHH